MAEEKMLQERFKTKKLYKLLKQTSLGGTITECLVKVKNGVGRIKTMDDSTNVFISTASKICEDSVSFSIGIADINLIIKLLESLDKDDVEVPFEIKNNFLCLKVKGKGKVKFLLVDTEKMEESYAEFTKGAKEILSKTSFESDLDVSLFADYIYYGDMFKITSSLIKIEDGNLTIGSGDLEKIEFKSELGKFKFENIHLYVYGNLFKKVFDVVDRDSPINLKLGDGCPVVITQGNNMWAFASSESESNAKEKEE